VNVYRCCGCKSSTFIYISKGFYYIISIFFISCWYGGFYNTKFFCLFEGFGWIYLFWAGFATKTPGHEVLIFPIYYALLAFEKDTKRGFSLFSLALAKTQRRKVFFFLLKNDYLLLETAPLAPIGVEILLLFSLKSKRLERIAGLAPYQ
jgi:hypothetical protein